MESASSRIPRQPSKSETRIRYLVYLGRDRAAFRAVEPRALDCSETPTEKPEPSTATRESKYPASEDEIDSVVLLEADCQAAGRAALVASEDQEFRYFRMELPGVITSNFCKEERDGSYSDSEDEGDYFALSSDKGAAVRIKGLSLNSSKPGSAVDVGQTSPDA